jgi:hypothetical protein
MLYRSRFSTGIGVVVATLGLASDHPAGDGSLLGTWEGTTFQRRLHLWGVWLLGWVGGDGAIFDSSISGSSISDSVYQLVSQVSKLVLHL